MSQPERKTARITGATSGFGDVGIWMPQAPGWLLLIRLVYAQGISAFGYEIGVSMGTQEPAEGITEVGVDYEGMAVLELYKKFIAGFFTQHKKAIVLLIALGQLCAAALLCNQKLRRLGIIGGCIFFLAIVPLGIVSAFLCTLLMAAGLVLMEYRRSTAVARQATTPNKS